MKAMLHRIVAMLTRMVMKFDSVAESGADYHAGVDYEHEQEHRFAEHDCENPIARTKRGTAGLVLPSLCTSNPNPNPRLPQPFVDRVDA